MLLNFATPGNGTYEPCALPANMGPLPPTIGGGLRQWPHIRGQNARRFLLPFNASYPHPHGTQHRSPANRGRSRPSGWGISTTPQRRHSLRQKFPFGVFCRVRVAEGAGERLWCILMSSIYRLRGCSRSVKDIALLRY